MNRFPEGTRVMLEVLPAYGRFDDVGVILRPRQKPEKACWCLTYRLSPAQIREAGETREDAMRALCSLDPGPGLVAYIDGEPVGWCGVGPRNEFNRLANSRTIQTIDDIPVWSVVCFVVRPGFRGRGVAAALLASAIDFARANGAPALEGYPVASEAGRVSGPFAFPGSTDLFEHAGFIRIAPTSSTSGGSIRWLMRLDLTSI